MARNPDLVLLAPLLATLVSGCLLFDPTFDESLVDEHGDLELTEVADNCSGDVPVWESSMTLRTISVHGLTDLVSDLSTCGLAEAESGPDAFFEFDALAGQRWHIMARPTDPNNDVAISIMSTCDERACVRAAQACSHGHAEHMNFVPQVGGRYIVGVQSAVHDDITVLAASPPCGDGVVQHGEACDDGNASTGDGCTPDCQAELLDPFSTEHEPNNEQHEANIIRLAEDTMSVGVSGQLGGACDIDQFAIEVPEGASIRAQLLDPSGNPCPTDLPSVEMSLVDARDFSVRGSVLGEGECPGIIEGMAFADGLAQGVYHVRVEALHADDGDHTAASDDGSAGDSGGHSDEGEAGSGGDHGDDGHGGSTGPIEGDPDLFFYRLEIEIIPSA